MARMASAGPTLGSTFFSWWKSTAERDGFFGAARQLAGRFWDFTRDSFPDRRRQRYGDIDYDFDFHVNTTGATVSWRDRLLGHFLSPYQPTEPGLFHEMLGALAIDFSQFTFIDLGSGKGRTLLMASDYPFRRVLGVEILPELNRVAEDNLRTYSNPTQKCFAIESACADASRFIFPPEPTVLYLFNPLPESALNQVVKRLHDSLAECPRSVYVIYHNPLLETVLANSDVLKKIGGTHQFAIYEHNT
jgi:SAM-dependent methyltransferase